MIRRFAGALAAALGLIAGLWLMLAPFALGTEPNGIDGSDWSDPTITEFVTGIVVAAIGLIGLIAFAAALYDEVVRRNTARVEAPRAGESMPATAARAAADQGHAGGEARPGAPDTELLGPLVQALVEDLRTEQEPERAGHARRAAAWGGDQ